MAVYDLEEQEQLDDLKAWWKQWGNTITVRRCRSRASRSPACRAGAGGRAPRRPTPSVLYSAVSDAARKRRSGEGARTRSRSSPTSSPAPPTRRARALVLRQACSSTPATRPARKAQLSWVIDNASDETSSRQIARFRLAEIAARRQAVRRGAEDARREACPTSFTGLFADLRGDALAAAGRAPKRAAPTRKRWPSSMPKSPYRMYVQVKLDTARRTVGCTAARDVGIDRPPRLRRHDRRATPVPAPASATPAAPAPATPAK